MPEYRTGKGSKSFYCGKMVGEESEEDGGYFFSCSRMNYANFKSIMMIIVISTL